MSQDRSTVWSVTINNPNDGDEEQIAMARQKGWKVDGQIEVGENGTRHYQLIVRTPQTRFASVKKMFSRAHIEIARNPQALEQYVHKDTTRVGELAVTNDKYPSLSKLWELIYPLIPCEGSWCVKDQDVKLRMFDVAIGTLIEDGYHVESMGVNPQIRSAFCKYWTSLRIRVESADRQTDRQTEISSEGINITNADYSPLDATNS